MKNLDSTEVGLLAGTKAPQAEEAITSRALRDSDELIDAACSGDREALNRLLAHARPRLIAVAMRIVRDRDDAEDVVQEALLKVCRYLTRFEGRSAFSTWLHRILVNTALDRLRHEQSRWERVLTAAERETNTQIAAYQAGRTDAMRAPAQAPPEQIAPTTAYPQQPGTGNPPDPEPGATLG